MVFVVYCPPNKINAVYEDEVEAEEIATSLYHETKEGWDVKDVVYFKKEPSSFHFNEDTIDFDENDYFKLNAKVNELENNLKLENMKFKTLLEFTQLITLLLVVTLFGLITDIIYSK